jgi:hypothetical protein
MATIVASFFAKFLLIIISVFSDRRKYGHCIVPAYRQAGDTSELTYG